MRLHKLQLKNIGPFKQGELNFITEKDNSDKPPIIIITGENGTGKTIILDAIRSMLFGQYGYLSRNIIRNDNFFIVKLTIDEKYPQKQILGGVSEIINRKFETNPFRFSTNNNNFNHYFCRIRKEMQSIQNKTNNNLLNNTAHSPTFFKHPKWITNYWTSNHTSDNFDIKKLITPDINNYLYNSLNGVQENIEVVELITFFDYLKDASSPEEQKTGEFFSKTIKKIVKLSLDKGEFAYVKRTNLQPVILQNNKEITLEKLSSGNLYLIQRMISLLGQMYAVHQIHNTPLNNICETPGLLLIDEAENHLHPKWQKTFINNILEIFPNLQIILTTHSPFIVSSVKNSRIYVCESKDDHAIIHDETAEYSNKSIEEILVSPLFGATRPFSTKISELLSKRKIAIKNNEQELRNKIEEQLKNINPNYFSYFDTDKLFEQLINKK